MALWGSATWDNGKWDEIVGQMAATESTTDTFAGEGDVIVAGAMAATESGVDTFASSGTVEVQGQMAAVETGVDQFAAEGTVEVRGEMAATESQVDTFSGEGDVILVGVMAATESGVDVFSAEGDVTVTGAMAAVETGVDVFIGEGDVAVVGYMAATESDTDTFAATGTVQPQPAPLITADVGAEKKRIKKRDEALEKYRQEQLALRKAIERAINPLADKAEPVVVAEGRKKVEVLGVDGSRLAIPVPTAFSAGEVARLVGEALKAAQIEATRVKRMQDAQRALQIARAELARIMKRKRDDELLLLMMD